MASISLHIGVPKTATSYIQAWLHQNRRALNKYGVFAPERPISSHRLAVEHLNGGIWDGRPDVIEIRKISYESARQEVQDALRSSGSGVVIVSSEYFYYANPAEVCASFRDQFGADLNVVVFIRSQGPLVLSGHNQDVKRLGKTNSRPRPQYQALYDWGLLLDSWAKQVGTDRLKAISFDASANRKTLLPDFVAAACPTMSHELSNGSFGDATFFNESLPADLLEFKRLANVWGECGLLEFLDEAMRSGHAGPRFGANAEEARDWRTLYEGSNRYVATKYFAGASVDTVFPVSADEDAGVDLEGRLPVETLARLLALEIKRQQKNNKALEERLRAIENQLAKGEVPAKNDPKRV